MDVETCIKRTGSGVLPGAVQKSSAFSRTSSPSDDSCFLLAGLSGSASDDSDILGDRFGVDFCCADIGVYMARGLCGGLIAIGVELLPNWKVVGLQVLGYLILPRNGAVLVAYCALEGSADEAGFCTNGTAAALEVEIFTLEPVFLSFLCLCTSCWMVMTISWSLLTKWGHFV